MDIQHICEEHVTVPIKVEVHNYSTNQLLIPETYHNSYESPQATHLLLMFIILRIKSNDYNMDIPYCPWILN